MKKQELVRHLVDVHRKAALLPRDRAPSSQQVADLKQSIDASRELMPVDVQPTLSESNRVSESVAAFFEVLRSPAMILSTLKESLRCKDNPHRVAVFFQAISIDALEQAVAKLQKQVKRHALLSREHCSDFVRRVGKVWCVSNPAALARARAFLIGESSVAFEILMKPSSEQGLFVQFAVPYNDKNDCMFRAGVCGIEYENLVDDAPGQGVTPQKVEQDEKKTSAPADRTQPVSTATNATDASRRQVNAMVQHYRNLLSSHGAASQDTVDMFDAIHAVSMANIDSPLADVSPEEFRAMSMDMIKRKCGNTCRVCGKTSSKQCVKCRIATYCSVDCQKTDWKLQHKHTCALDALYVRIARDTLQDTIHPASL